MNTNTFNRNILYGLIAFAIAGFAYFMGLNTLLAKAAALVFSPADCYTANATTTLAYMTPGTATTTVTCPMGSDGADSASLAIQVNASSTATSFNVYVEESMDGQDWYPIPSASTTDAFSLQIRPYSTFTFASSTIGGTTGMNGASTTFQGYTSTNNRNHYLIDVPVRMKRVRAFTTMPIGSTNGAVWMQIIPKTGI